MSPVTQPGCVRSNYNLIQYWQLELNEVNHLAWNHTIIIIIYSTPIDGDDDYSAVLSTSAGLPPVDFTYSPRPYTAHWDAEDWF